MTRPKAILSTRGRKKIESQKKILAEPTRISLFGRTRQREPALRLKSDDFINQSTGVKEGDGQAGGGDAAGFKNEKKRERLRTAGNWGQAISGADGFGPRVDSVEGEGHSRWRPLKTYSRRHPSRLREQGRGRTHWWSGSGMPKQPLDWGAKTSAQERGESDATKRKRYPKTTWRESAAVGLKKGKRAAAPCIRKAT